MGAAGMSDDGSKKSLGVKSFSYAIVSTAKRSGEWTIASRYRAGSLLSANFVDLTSARLSSSHTTIIATAVAGGIDVLVPEDMRVTVIGTSLLGTFRLSDGPGVTVAQEDLPADAPTLEVRGMALLGGVYVFRVPRRH